MAQFGISKSAGSVVALLSLFALIGLIVYAMAAAVQLGWILYILALATAVIAWMAKEDSIVVGAVMLLCLLVMLDVVYYIGVIGPYP